MDVIRVVVMISADAEWEAVRQAYPQVEPQNSPYGEWFFLPLPVGKGDEPVVFFQGGWGKIAAAASTQYAIDRWRPALLVNLGTCGVTDLVSPQSGEAYRDLAFFRQAVRQVIAGLLALLPRWIDLGLAR